MEAWISILHEKQIFPTGYCRQAAAAIFKVYLEVNNSSPFSLSISSSRGTEKSLIPVHLEHSKKERKKERIFIDLLCANSIL